MTITYQGKLAGPDDLHSSNDIAVNIFEEAQPGVLPAAAQQYAYGLEINSFSAFGGAVESIRRRYFEARRQLGKGRVQRITAEASWQADATDEQFGRYGRSFFFADNGTVAYEPKGAKADTQSIFNNKKTSIGAITGGNNIALVNTKAQLGTPAFKAGDIILISDRDKGPNDGKVVVCSSASGTALTFPNAAVVNQSAPATPVAPDIPRVRLHNIGYQFTAGSVSLTYTNSILKLSRTSGTLDLTTLGLQRGEWIVVGGDGEANRFGTTSGFARISRIEAAAITFDDQTFSPAAAAGSGKTIQIYYGEFVYNGNTKRTYTVERILGTRSTDNAAMADYVIGAIPNELTMNFDADSIVNVDYTWIPLQSAGRKFGEEICSQVSGVWHVPRTGVGGFATQIDILRTKLHIKGASEDLFSFVTSGSFSLTNNVTGAPALGSPGFIGYNVGSFEGSGSVEAYFQGPEATEAIQDNESAYFNIVSVAKDTRQGLVVDLPEVTLAGSPTVALDENIKLPLEMSASEDPVLGYTSSFCQFAWVPLFVQ